MKKREPKSGAEERRYVPLGVEEARPNREERGAATAAAAAPVRRFGAGGFLEKVHDGYEYRGSQLEMAEMVEEAFAKHQHVIVEAGTGTGKTLAYLLPAIRSGRTVVISTATKSLQEQLYTKDIPFLQKHFAPNLKVAVMKGRNNFLCRQKVHDLEGRPVLKGFEEVDWFTQIRDWAKVTETGDRAELNFLPDDNDLWGKLDARRDTCTGQKCPEFQNCFLTKMRQRAQEANILIVNHHLFFADLALRSDDWGSILPDYSAVVFDEAHEMEDIASDFFGQRISNYQFEELARDTEQVLRVKGLGRAPLLKRTAQLKEKSRNFFDALGAKEGRYPFSAQERASFVERNQAAYDELAAAVKKLETELASVPGKPEEVVQVARRGSELRKQLEFLFESNEKNHVYWYERRGKGVFV
ncbi:MAG: ATP-dependent DNA helicase, partial [Acidobacteria bacterium]|nr:ATP-dependent DNA helicase [Acidobacteriota bacterium]